MKIKTLIKKLEECYSEKQKDFWCELPKKLAPDILLYLRKCEEYEKTIKEIEKLLSKALDVDETDCEESFDLLYEALEKCEV